MSTYTSSLQEFDEAQVIDRIAGERFVTHDEVGRGGFGTVRAVYDRWLGTEVALKVFPEGDLKTDILRLRALPAQYFVRSFDYGKNRHGTWYTMELLCQNDGWFSLSDFSSGLQGARVENAEASLFALFIVKELCIGLGELHQNHYHKKSYFHGDIKPANVFFNVNAIKRWRDEIEGPQGPYVKIIDLGASLEVGNPSTIMTPAYASPEQKNGGDCSIAVDAFAIGQILFELLSSSNGQLGNEEIGRKQKILSYLKQHGSFVRERAALLIEQATKPRVQDRAECEQLASELDDLFSLYLMPPVWRAIRLCEQMADANNSVVKPDFLSAIEEDLLKSKYRTKTSPKLKKEAESLLSIAISDGIFESAGRNLLCIA